MFEMYMHFFCRLAFRGATHDRNNYMLNKIYGMHIEMYMHVFFLTNSTFEEGDMIITITL